MPSYELIRRALAVRGPIRFGSGGDHNMISGAGFPASGTAGDGAGHAGPGSHYWDRTRGTAWVNDGTRASPYWRPLGYDQPEMWGVHADWRDTVGVAIAGTTMSVILAGSGIRVFGDGHADTDSGAVANSVGEGGYTMRLTTTNETLHLICLGMEAGVWQADQHGMCIIEGVATQVSAITSRSFGIGAVGTAIDAFVAAITGATTVATLVQDDLALLHMSTGYTDADRMYVAHNKSNENATMTAVDTAVNLAAAATEQEFRVELEPVGTVVIMRAFIDKVLVATVADALDEDEEHSPIMFLESLAVAGISMDVRRFSFVSGRA